MQSFFEGLASFGAGLDKTVLGTLLGVTITCIVTWTGHVVTHSGTRAASRLARAERRAVLAVRDLAPDAAGGFGGRLRNLGATAARGVTLETDADALAFGVVGPGEAVDFRFPSAVVDGARLRIAFADFADVRRRETLRLAEAGGVITLKPHRTLLRRLLRMGA